MSTLSTALSNHLAYECRNDQLEWNAQLLISLCKCDSLVQTEGGVAGHFDSGLAGAFTKFKPFAVRRKPLQPICLPHPKASLSIIAACGTFGRTILYLEFMQTHANLTA